MTDRSPRAPGPPVALLLALAVVVGGLGGCRPAAAPAPELDVDWSISPRPAAVGPATVTVELAHAATGEPVAGAAVEVEGNMTHPGMTPSFGTGREIAPGTYEAPLELTMGGDWYLLVEVTLPDGRTVERQLDLPGVRSGGP